MQPNTRGLITYCSEIRTLTAEQCRALEDKYTPALHISPTTPPTFLYGTTDDETVSVQASVEYYRTLIDHGVSAEMHLFRHGNHGSGLGGGDPALDTWPILLELWLRGQGFL
jgi:dipeptidyl aminopeptidase/acylaminoacyl peptidase